MLFTFSEFEKVKKEIKQQFEKKPAIDVGEFEWSEGFNEYRKILNDLRQKKRKKERNCQSATRVKNSEAEVRPKTQRFNQKFENLHVETNCFYLTEHLENQQNQKSQDNSMNGHDKQNDELLGIIIKLSQCTEINKNLKDDIRQLQNSIRCFRKNNYQLEWLLKQEDRRQNSAITILQRKKNQYINFKNRNNQFKTRLGSTQRFFGRSLQSVKVTVKKNQEKANQMMEEVAEARLVKQKLQQKLEAQQETLEKLSIKSKDKEEKTNEMKQLFRRAQSLLYTSEISLFIRKYGYGELDEMQALCDRLFNEKNLSSNQIVTKIQNTNILKLGRQIVKIYKKMKIDEGRLKQIYEFKILQKGEHEEEFQNIKRTSTKYYCEDDRNNNNALITLSEQRQLYLQKQAENKLRRFCEMIESIEERSKFFIKKLIKLLILIIETWLQYDQSAIQFTTECIETFAKTLINAPTSCSSDYIKRELKRHFENWEKYMFFCDEAVKNSIILRVLSKKEVVHYFRKIIKTKLNDGSKRTEDLFAKSLNKLFDSSISDLHRNISNLLNCFRNLYFYASKYQVLIVNNRDPQVKFSTNQKPKARLLYPMSKKQERILEQQEKQQQLKVQQQQRQKNRYQNQEMEIFQDHPEFYSYILEYQDQINTISKLNKKNKMNRFKVKSNVD